MRRINMKKYIALILTILVVMSLTSCGSSGGSTLGASQEPDNTQESSQAPSASESMPNEGTSQAGGSYLVFRNIDDNTDNIKVECDNGYTLKKDGQEFSVNKGDKEILRGSIAGSFFWNSTRTTNDETIKMIETTDDLLFYWKGEDRLCRLIKVSQSYPYLSGKISDGVTEGDLIDAMNSVHFSVTNENPS